MTRDDKILKSIKKRLPELKKLLKEISAHWCYEDLVYRYYHGSFKVYYIQEYTNKMVNEFEKIAKDCPVTLNEDFINIVKNGTGLKFDYSHNKDWDTYTRPQLEAFFHAKFFLEMIVKYGKKLKSAPQMLDSGWAAVLYLFNSR